MANCTHSTWYTPAKFLLPPRTKRADGSMIGLIILVFCPRSSGLVLLCWGDWAVRGCLFRASLFSSSSALSACTSHIPLLRIVGRCGFWLLLPLRWPHSLERLTATGISPPHRFATKARIFCSPPSPSLLAYRTCKIFSAGLSVKVNLLGSVVCSHAWRLWWVWGYQEEE